jgi:2-pyrone-4,6-dicarboxylate lactonase
LFDERAAADRAAKAMRSRGQDDLVRAPAWHRAVPKPRMQLPPGACDSHLHVIGPQEVFPLLPESPFKYLAFDDSTADDWLTVRDALGLSRGVHVQSFMYGCGYHHMVHTLMRAEGSLRGVAAVWPGITDGELDILSGAGVVGARFAYALHPRIDERLVGRLVDRNWSLHYSLGSGADADWRRQILARPGRFVLEHIGMSPADRGVDSPQFRFVLDCLETGRCWVKLSTRPSNQDTLPFSDLKPLVNEVLTRAPDRALWGSDWPHIPYFRPMPNEAELLDINIDWLTDEGLVTRVFVKNPAEAFDWPYGPEHRAGPA